MCKKIGYKYYCKELFVIKSKSRYRQTGLITERLCVSHNNNIPINIPGHPYVLMNQSILCNCNIEAESNFLLESLAACEGPETKTDLEMHFTINLAFVNYFNDIIEELGIPISQNWTTQETNSTTVT